MKLFVDTSAFYALLDKDDTNHRRAAAGWQDIHSSGQATLTHNYVLVEITALVQRRLGIAAVQALSDELIRPVEVFWVTRELHQIAIASLLANRRRDLSLVDWVSFQVMRQLGLRTAFAFDPDFQGFGFSTVPSSAKTV